MPAPRYKSLGKARVLVRAPQAIGIRVDDLLLHGVRGNVVHVGRGDDQVVEDAVASDFGLVCFTDGWSCATGVSSSPNACVSVVYLGYTG